MGEVKLKGISSNHVADEQNILFNNALKAINRGYSFLEKPNYRKIY